MFMFFVRANGVQALRSEYSDDAAEYVRLLKVDIDQLGGLNFDVLDRLCDVVRL